MMSRASYVILLAVFWTPATLFAQDGEQLVEYERRIDEQQRELDAQRRELDALRRELDALKASAADTTVADARNRPTASDDGAPPAADRKLPGPFVLRKSEDLSVQFSGRVHRMLMGARDGASTNTLFTDSEQGPTMLRFDAKSDALDNLSIGATIEMGIRQNRPLLVSQDKSDGGTSVNSRIAEIAVDAKSLGKLSLGRGFSAGWLTPEIDLSGTQFASLLSVGMLAPGLKFVDSSTNALTDIQVHQHFADLERLLLADRVRYDSAAFGPGLQLSSSIAADSRWEVALRAKPKASQNWTMVGGAAYLNKPFGNIDRRVDVGFSVRHNDSGLNLTGAFGREELAGESRNADTYVIKIGWLANLLEIGQTAFSLDYFENRDIRLAGDRSKSFGFFVVQKWPAFGTDFYGGIRRYDVDRPDVELEPLDALVIGAALQF